MHPKKFITILLTLISFSCSTKRTCTYYYEAGKIQQAQTNYYDAITLYSKSIKSSSTTYLQAYRKRAESYLSLDSLLPAIRDYDTLIKYSASQDDLASFYILKGNALYLNSQDKEACDYYYKARNLNSTQAWDKIRLICM